MNGRFGDRNVRFGELRADMQKGFEGSLSTFMAERRNPNAA